MNQLSTPIMRGVLVLPVGSVVCADVVSVHATDSRSGKWEVWLQLRNNVIVEVDGDYPTQDEAVRVMRYVESTIRHVIDYHLVRAKLDLPLPPVELVPVDETEYTGDEYE